MTARLYAAGDLVTAEAAAASAGSLAIADVIYYRGGPGCARPLAWLAGTLDR